MRTVSTRLWKCLCPGDSVVKLCTVSSSRRSNMNWVFCPHLILWEGQVHVLLLFTRKLMPRGFAPLAKAETEVSPLRQDPQYSPVVWTMHTVRQQGPQHSQAAGGWTSKSMALFTKLCWFWCLWLCVSLWGACRGKKEASFTVFLHTNYLHPHSSRLLKLPPPGANVRSLVSSWTMSWTFSLLPPDHLGAA